ncbi:STAS domain-containing protein [Peribacillus frigoritolerans]|uniref:STAS domain-containing protein n=1 Tax=Peribacillus frigoritolerans TaxID=450367 RepID=UPI003D280073
MGSISTVATYLNENAESLANEIVDEIIHRFDFEVPEDEIKQGIIVYTEFIEFLAKAVTSPEITVPQEIIDWSKKNAEREASLMGRISNVIERYHDTRLVFIERMTKITMEHGLSTEEVVLVNKRINSMLDISITETILAFERVSSSIIKQSQIEVNELSAPIVPIHDDIAVLPLIGSFDYDRVEHLLNKIVPRIPERNVKNLIIDFSGLLTIDEDVAGYIFNVNDVLRLLGINVIVTGIRPDLAATVVSRGIDLSALSTYATVKQAIASMK